MRYLLALGGNNIYAGTRCGYVLKTTNDGNDWLTINTGLSNNEIMSIAINGKICLPAQLESEYILVKIMG